MSKYVQWIEYRGKKILVSNYSGLEEKEQIKAMEETKQELLKQPAGSQALTLTDVSKAPSTAATRDKAKDLEAAIKGKGFVSHAAIVGMSGWQKTMAQLIKPDAYFAKSIEDAKDWLVEQAGK